MRVPVGRPVHIPCLAEGNPVPKIEWRKIVASNEEHEVLGANLRFSSIEQRDSGTYECRASNGIDEDLLSRITLDVLGK